MAEGERDGFIENDVIGNYARGTVMLGNSTVTHSRKKRKKHNKKMSHVHRRRKRAHKQSRRRKIRHHSRNSKIKYTKHGQPYRIMPNGRARFIKK